MGSRPVHFEIHADDVARAVAFYGEVFGWTFEDWSEFAGMPYFGATTGEEGTPGINGAIMARRGGGVGPGAPVNGAALTDRLRGLRHPARGHPGRRRAGRAAEGARARDRRGRATTSTPRATSSDCISPTPKPPEHRGPDSRLPKVDDLLLEAALR